MNNIPTPRWMLSASCVNGKIYAIGGYDGQGSVSTVEEFDPAEGTWSVKSSMPTARWGFATAVVNDRIYAIGGAGEYPASEIYKVVEVYDPATDSWTSKSPGPTGRIGIAACTVNGKMYAIGGAGTIASVAYSVCYVFDPDCDTIKD